MLRRLPQVDAACYTQSVKELWKSRSRFVVLVLIAGAALRLLFILKYQAPAGDSLLYAELARNLLGYHLYGFNEGPRLVPSLIRLPGYPIFLSIVYLLSGYRDLAILLAQLVVDLGTALIVGEIAAEAISAEAAPWAFTLAALCPFTANYVALILSETLAVFFAALTLLFALRATRREQSGLRAYRQWLYCGAAVAGGILLRPDGGIFLMVLGAYFTWRLFRRPNKRYSATAGVLVAVVALAPLVPWTVRNWRVVHVFQPLAPRYANAPDEYVPDGFNRWIKTWIVDYSSVEDVYWKVSVEPGGEEVDTDMIPSRAYDNAAQKESTEELFDEYNQKLLLTPKLDVGFAELARERVHEHPLRYYIELPILRMGDMWFRPRTEMLPNDEHWWDFDNPGQSWFSIFYALFDILLVGLGAYGAFRFRRATGWWLMVGFVVVRTLFLGTLENPEPRYTLECFPVVLIFAGAALWGILRMECLHTAPATAICR